jgi:heme o synthase
MDMTSTITNSKSKAYFQLTKFRLSLTVVLSSLFGYALAADEVDIYKILALGIGAFLVTASANIINQIKEKDLDKLMQRTSLRPLPTGVLTVKEAAIFCIFCGLIGLSLIYLQFNFKAFLLSLLSLLLYGFVYTPLKRVGPVAVAVGALPGAFPPMIGWLAYSNQFSLEPGILFAIQFFWQFPHFWAIAWVTDEDYRKAGFKLLPSSGGTDLKSAVQIMIYTLFLLPLCWLPYYLNMTGVNSGVVASICGVLFLAQTFYLMVQQDRRSALLLMFGSFVYLPVVQLAYFLDKI